MSKSTNEQRALTMMRKTLANVIKDVTPQLGESHPLAQETLDDIRSCLTYIVSREKELLEQTDMGVELIPKFQHNTKSQAINLKSIK